MSICYMSQTNQNIWQEKDMADDIEMFVKMMFQVMVDTTLGLSEKVVSHPSYISVRRCGWLALPFSVAW